MERDRERHRHPLPRQFLDRGNEAHRGDGDVAGAHSEALRRRINQTVKRGNDRLVVREGLPHAHKDDVRELRGPARELSISARGLGLANLVDDLRRRKVTSQSHLSRRAERARHAAASLRRDAQRRSLGVAHENRLDLRAVVQAPQVLDRAPTVSFQRHDLGDEVRKERLRHRIAHPGRDIAHVRGVGFKMREVMARQLIGAKSGQPQVLEYLLTARGIQICEVRRRLATPLSRERQDRLSVLVRRTLRRLIGRTNLTARAATLKIRHPVGVRLMCLRPAGPLRRLAQWLDSQEIPGSAHAKMK